MKKRPPVQLGQRIQLSIHDLGHTGEGIGWINGYTVFVNRAIVGDIVEVEITQMGQQFGRATVTKWVKPSIDRITPKCPVFDDCGGCQIQSMTVSAQGDWKTSRIQQLFERAKFDSCPPVQQILTNPSPWRYRNKAVIPVSVGSDGNAVAGFFAKQSHDIVPMADCLIQPESVSAITQKICNLIDATGATIYNEIHKTGLIRGVVIRTAPNQLVVTVVVNGTTLPEPDRWVSVLQTQPDLTGFGIMINTGVTNVPITTDVRPLWGSLELDYQVSGMVFRAPIYGFFQVNPYQTSAMVNWVKTQIGTDRSATVYDLYCGVGTFGLAIASQVGRVYGCELTPEAKHYATINASQNGIHNATFETGDATAVTQEWTKQGIRPDIIIIDPPRKGCDSKLIELIVSLRPKTLVYVSCDPATLVRDLRQLSHLYRIEAIQPVDMFTHTAHIETMVLAKLR